MPTENLYSPHTLTVLHKQNKNEASDLSYTLHLFVVCVGPHGKAIAIHAGTGPKGSRMLRLPEFPDKRQLPPLPPRRYLWY